jgi:pilus assembly protein CpaE
MIETQTLLPTASVDIFLKDKETLNAARALGDDWRFARVNTSVEEGGVEAAIASYKEAQSPDLIIIETESTGEDFTELLGQLSAHCAENTNAIIIGPVNDVTLYRNLTAMGVSDYLVKPVPLETLSEIIAQTLIKQLGTSGSRLIAVVGAKGGVGSSSLAQGMAWGLSETLGHKTFLMDAAGGWTSLPVGMGFEPTATLYEAVKAASNKDRDSLKRMLNHPNDKLTVLATGSDPMLEVSVHAQQYEELVDYVMQSYPVVLVDLSDAIPSLKRTVLTKAHEIVLVTTPTLPALRATRTLMQEIKLLHGGSIEHVDLIVNMAGMVSGKEVPKKDIEEALEKKPEVVIPFDAKLFVGSENEGRKLTHDKAGAGIVNTLLPVAQRVLNAAQKNEEPAPQGGFLSRMLGGLGKKE